MIFVRRGSLVDWFNMLVIRFVLSLFVFSFAVRRFAPDWFTVHRFLQPNRGEVTKFVTHDVINPRRRVRGRV